MENKNQRFRLIALRPLEGCYPKYLKILKENVFYIFYNDYEEDKRTNTIRRKEEKDLIESFVPVDFYQSKKTKLNISVSAIIGKNGGGKSTIVELIMRILNNFSYVAGFLEKQNTLLPIKGIYAELYYEIDGELAVIEINGNNIVWKSPKSDPISFSLIDLENNPEPPKDRIETYFFYTQISNYSLYAYNSKELEGESEKGDWITGIFHKNDGYQTPVVLNPMRTEGNIDINIENVLSKDRLISLFLTDDETQKSFRRINKDQLAIMLEIKPYQRKSKLEEKSLRDFFINYQQEWRTDFYYNPKSSTKRGIEEYQNDLNRLASLLDQNTQSTSETYEISEGQSFLINLGAITKLISQERFFYFWNKSLALYPELGKLNSSILQSVSILEKTYEKIGSKLLDKNLIDKIKLFFESEPISIDEIEFSHEEKEPNKFLNLIHLQRIITVALCDKIWRERLEDETKTESDDIENELYEYITYKTISIISKYQNYDSYRKSIFTEFDFLEDRKALNNLEKDLTDAIKKIYEEDILGEKTHITLKIRQCINFFCRNKHPYRKNEYSNKKCEYIPISQFYQEITKWEKNAKEEPYEYFLPPIFESDVIILQTNDNIQTSEKYQSSDGSLFVFVDVEKDKNLTRLSQLSSGERQQLNVVSSVIYHLRNLSSVSKEETHWIKYRHINLIFEEIELYFHPEYQRTFINFLLNHLSKIQLGLQSVNLCFVTHSPFILSDIPKQNILTLEEGKPCSIPFDTLGANIHELLANDFFMENGFMGEFVREKIISLLDFLRIENGQNTNEWTKENALQFINLIGEPLINERLSSMYKAKYPRNRGDIEKQIELLKKEMRSLPDEKNFN